MAEGLVGMALPQAHDVFQRSGNGMSIKKALFGGGVETNATASYQGSIQSLSRWIMPCTVLGDARICDSYWNTIKNRCCKALLATPMPMS